MNKKIRSLGMDVHGMRIEERERKRGREREKEEIYELEEERICKLKKVGIVMCVCVVSQ